MADDHVALREQLTELETKMEKARSKKARREAQAEIGELRPIVKAAEIEAGVRRPPEDLNAVDA